jgi:serine/threonine protein kinase
LKGIFVLKRLKNLKRFERFKTEIEILKNLKHKNILKIVDYNLDAEKPYFVSEYCDGGSLQDANEKNPLWHNNIEEKFRLCLEICEGLSAAHHNNPPIYHRDLKPDNIYLSCDTPVIGDWGICYIEGGERYTITGEAVGSRNYMHPELEDGRIDNIHYYHDLYSLGKVIYWIFSEGKMFSRERHRQQQYDLKIMFANHYYEHLNRLLDVLIANDLNKICQNLPEVIIKLSEIEGLMSNHFNPIGKDIPQKCYYCGIGEYQVFKKSNRLDQFFGRNQLY